MNTKKLRGLVIAPVLALAAGSALADSHAMGEPDCKLSISRTEIGFIVTIGGGSGTLNCDGTVHRVRIGGLKIGGAGASGSTAEGEVYNLKNLSDFNGVYSETKAQATIAKGRNVMDLANDNGVRVRLRGTSQGFDLQLAGGGLKMTLE